MTELWELENEIYDSGVTLLCGVDEAGRGPLAGPVYAAAVMLPRGCEIPGLNDSKKLTEKRREELFDVIRGKALAYGIARAEVAEIASAAGIGEALAAEVRKVAGSAAGEKR